MNKKNLLLSLIILMLTGCHSVTNQTQTTPSTPVPAQSSNKKLALLLPLSGQYAQQGKTVREGFLNSYYDAMAKNEIVPTLSFYDTVGTDMNTVYQKAVNEGANIIVGPLLKENVQTLTSSVNVSVPTLALNYTARSSTLPNHLYQFGLSPHDEAEQLAEKAKQAGLSRALLIAPQTEWGQDISKTLIAHWQSQGGLIVDTLYFNNQTDFNQAIPTFLQVTPGSQQRRQDFDVIFLLAQSAPARQIVPALHYNFVQNVPIYSTSIIYSGVTVPSKDTDLNGIIFCDAPWSLAHQGKTNRLYAVGKDAFTLSQELLRTGQLSDSSVEGATGTLSLTPQRQIHRQVVWTQFNEGHA